MNSKKFNVTRAEKGVTINAAMQKLAGFHPEEALSFHVNDGLILLSKSKLTAKDLVDMANNLYLLAGELVSELVDVCGTCDGCFLDECDLFDAIDQGEPVQLREDLREAIGIPEDGAMEVTVDEESGTITVKAAEDKYDLYSVPPQIMALLLPMGICLSELDMHLRQGDVVYGD